MLQPAGDQTVSSFSFFCPISPQHITTRGTLFVLLCGRLLWLCIRRGVALLRTYTLLLAVPTLPFTQQSVPSRASHPGSSLTYRNRLRTSGPLGFSALLTMVSHLVFLRRPEQPGKAEDLEVSPAAGESWKQPARSSCLPCVNQGPAATTLLTQQKPHENSNS